MNFSEQEKIKVLIVDDSAVMRLMISNLLSQDDQIEIVGTASQARAAYEKIEQLSPDLVTLDIEMPEIDGITALTNIKQKYPRLPVIMCSTLTENGAEATMSALEAGADDYVCKPSSSSGQSKDTVHEAFRRELGYKIKKLATPQRKKTSLQENITIPPVIRAPKQRVDIVAIGTSTGGPMALREVLTKIPADFPVPIVIVQHMPPLFTKILAESLQKKMAIPVSEVSDGTIIEAGQVYIAPGNYHMVVSYQKNRYQLVLNQDEEVNYCRPSVDVLFRSVAKNYGKHALGVILTGMGHDGRDGCQEIKNNGGRVLAQDQETSVVWGMPGAVSKEGLAEQILPIKNIAAAIIQQVRFKRE